MYNFVSGTDFIVRFGNFIGEEVEQSEEESQHGIEAGAYVYDDYPEEVPEATGQELMEIDGLLSKIPTANRTYFNIR